MIAEVNLATASDFSDDLSPGERLAEKGFAVLRGPLMSLCAASRAARTVCRRARRLRSQKNDWPALEVIGDFVVPPIGGGRSRDFQALHFDFGLPLDPRTPRPVAHYTALHISVDRGPVEAETRLVPLDALLGQRRWAPRDELVRRFSDYGVSRGAWDQALGYSEGILGRLIEAADDREPVLPAVGATDGFLCGTEFASASEERRFFEHRALRPEDAEIRIRLDPGQLLVFDNLALAHGRVGRRSPGELHQRMLGYPRLSKQRQRAIRDGLLDAFSPDH